MNRKNSYFPYVIGLILYVSFAGPTPGATPMLSAGSNHSMFLKSDETAWAVGWSGDGQLGDGTSYTNRKTLFQVMNGVQAVSASADKSLFLKVDGTAWATGRNYFGDLGNGTYTRTLTPLQVMSDVKAIYAGNAHSLFLKKDGVVWAAGANSDGRLGDGTTTSRPTPVQVMSNVKAISAGMGHSLFLKNDGTVWATGYNFYGQLGDGTKTNRLTPVQVMSNVKAISAGDNNSFFLKTDDTVWATGSNGSSSSQRWDYTGTGKFGDGTTTDRTTPVQVMGGVQSVHAGGDHTIFIKSDGTAWTTGYNSSGQLGDGTTTNRSTPAQVMTGVQLASAASAGGQYSLFLKIDGAVWATGSNSNYQLGDGTDTMRLLPTQLQIWLTPDTSPAFTSQPPFAFAAVATQTVTLSVAASGTPTPTFQWQKNGINIAGATNSTLTLNTVQTADAGNYRCLATNTLGSVLSTACEVSIYSDTFLTIREQPSHKVVTQGGSVTFSILASSIEPIGYQWRKNGMVIQGATAATYTIPVASSTDAGNYSCIVSDLDELFLSAAATLTVQVAPTITSQPSARTVLRGQSASFTVVASGSPTPTYQWRLNGVVISGATDATYTIASAQSTNAGSYDCVVTNSLGDAISTEATLTVNVPATILSSPSPVAVDAGGQATFTVSATGTPTLTYQWKKNGEVIAGATSNTLSLTNVRFLSEADYTCEVRNAYGTIESAAATLTATINPASPDTDADGLSDSLETYLSELGLNSAKNSTKEWARLLAMIPDLGVYYTADQIRGLAIGQPVLERAGNGNFRLNLRMLDSEDLNTWVPRVLNSGNVTVIDGNIQVEVTPPTTSTQFYRVQTVNTP